MQFRIAETFTDSLARLTGDEQKAVKTTAFDLQLNPASPGMQFHKLDRARDKNFWSVRVSRDIRMIVHKSDASLLLCYVDHHDNAYHWAERRKLETHPKTGAAQLVEIRETVKEITIPKYVEQEQTAPLNPLLFETLSEEQLLAYGVPADWVDDVRLANEETLFDLANHLPREATEALLEIATGGTPSTSSPVAAETDPFEHPDARRRFRLMPDAEELVQALDYPWEKWTVFLHPAQRELVERDYNGPTRVAGSAGTGKTVVALHRAAHLASKDENARVLVTTFSETLARALETNLRKLLSKKPKLFERIEVYSMQKIATRLYSGRIGQAQLASGDLVRELLQDVAAEKGVTQYSDKFLWAEWHDVVDAWQLDTWEAYRDVARLGRKTRLGEQQRRILWDVFSQVRHVLAERNLLTNASMLGAVTEKLKNTRSLPFDYCVVDEAQDVGVSEMRLLSALAGDKHNGLFFAGDLGQRIFQLPFSWKSLGVDVRGRSRTLRINYRTSHQIRSQADRLLPPEMADIDGNLEVRKGTISAFDGPAPHVEVFESRETEIEAVRMWLTARLEEGLLPEEIALFARSPEQFDRVRAAAESAGLESIELATAVESREGVVSILAMHLAKGLEFRAVAVMACDDEILPLQQRIASVGDNADLEEVYNTERHLLYVACTRARDYLMVSGVDPASEFLDDLSL